MGTKIRKQFDKQVNITLEDITKGVPTDPCRCMVARAVRRATHKRYGVDVYGGFVILHHGGKWKYKATLPDEVCNQVNRYDDQEPGQDKTNLVKPCNFVLTFKEAH
jgi:hypothetical protein